MRQTRLPNRLKHTPIMAAKSDSKWHYLIDSGIKISADCCGVMKKSPLKSFEKKNDLLTTILYNKENFDKKISHPFPIYYEDEAGNKIWAKPDEEKMKKVDLANDCVLVLAWHRDRMRNIIKIIAKKLI